MSIIVSLLCLIFYNLLNVAYFYGEIVSIVLYIYLFIKYTSLTLKQSAIAVIVGYLVGPVLLAGIIYFLLTNLGMISEAMISTNTDHMISLMTVLFMYAVVAILIGQIMYQLRIGFLFVKEEIVKINKSVTIKVTAILSFSIISFLFLGNIIMYNPSFLDIEKVVYSTVIILAIILFLYLVNIEKIAEEHKKVKEKIRM